MTELCTRINAPVKHERTKGPATSITFLGIRLDSLAKTCHLIDLSTSINCLHHHITLNREAKADLHWWLNFLSSWSGTSLLLQSHWSLAPDMQQETDASDSYGGYWAGHWFSQPWPPSLRHYTIARRETYAVLIACTTWGTAWQWRSILFHCDNQCSPLHRHPRDHPNFT